MARKPNVFPSYLRHNSGQARIRVNGRDIMLGLYGSDASRVKYGQLIAKLAGGVPIDPLADSQRGRASRHDPEADPGPTVGELCLGFLRHAEIHYVKNGRPTSQLHLIKDAIRLLNELFGVTPAIDFGPLALKAVRAKMVEKGWTRGTVNSAMSRIRRIFKFAVADELIDPGVLQRLQAVAPLLAGRTEARDNPPRTAVGDADIAAVRELVSPLVCDLIDVQRLTGARCGELLGLTTGAINRAGEVWTAVLSDHKTAHHGQSRTLHFGPQSQLILTRHLKADPNALLFDITRNGYRRAVTRACEVAKIDRWVPHQLRHTAADAVRQQFGLEHCQSVLGHSKADMTEHYAKAGNEKAREVALKIG